MLSALLDGGLIFLFFLFTGFGDGLVTSHLEYRERYLVFSPEPIGDGFPEEEHKTNSPWNIAAEFAVDMSFSVKDIAGMFTEYEAGHN